MSDLSARPVLALRKRFGCLRKTGGCLVGRFRATEKWLYGVGY
jgi:hypothetical protein